MIDTTTPIAPVPRQRRLLRVAIQIVGFAAGLASLGWCLSLALRPENKAQFDKLVHAPRHLLLAMLALSLATVIINGLLFWVGLLPVRRLKLADVLATNALCTFLGYLPLKAGAIVRILIHNRRDGVPVLTIGSWFASMGLTMAAAFGPPLLGVLWIGHINRQWFAVVGAMELVAAAAVVILARAFEGERGIERLSSIAHSLHLAPIRALLRSKVWAKLHPGFAMIASPVTVTATMVLRLLDVCVHSARFLVAAHILGVHLPMSQAVPISLTFFLIGIVSPSGLAGLREGAATGLAGVLLAKTGATEDSFTNFAAVALLVSATEAIVFLAAAALGVAWLRPDRLLKLRDSGNGAATSQDSPGRSSGPAQT